MFAKIPLSLNVHYLINRWVGTWQKSVKVYFLDVITVLLFSVVSYVKMYSHWN